MAAGDVIFNGSGIIHLDHRAVTASIVSTADWSTDSSGSTLDFSEYLSGTGAANNRVMDYGPYGDEVYVWEGGSASQTGAISGFNGGNSAGELAVLKSIDNTKTYRFSMWARVKSAMTNGSCYLGLRAFEAADAIDTITDISNGGTTANPYFALCTNANLATYFPTGEWRLVSCFLHPYTHSGTTDTTTTGIVKPDGTNLGTGGGNGDLKWASTTLKVLIRFFGPYNENGSGKFQVWNPRIDVVDGTEPPFNELLTGRKGLLLSDK